jgi:hypothetical protein
LFGVLPGWSGWDKPCGYKGCKNRAAFAGVPGQIKHVCLSCASRPKVSAFGTRLSLREYVIRQAPLSPRALEWMAPVVARIEARNGAAPDAEDVAAATAAAARAAGLSAKLVASGSNGAMHTVTTVIAPNYNEDQAPDSKPGFYYVTAMDAGRVARIAGPYVNDHASALADVARVKQEAERRNDRAVWWAWGTTRYADDQGVGPIEGGTDAQRARDRFAGLTDEGRAYCAKNGSDEYAQGERPEVRRILTRLCGEWELTQISARAAAPAPTAPSASTHEITSEMLASIRVLFRRDDSLCLYGIPYDMRPGQSPGDLWRASTRHRERPPAVGFPAYVQPKPDPRLDPMHGWIWLGSPGWWGSMSPESRARVEAWLAAHDGVIPEGPFEWCALDLERCTICYQPAHATETDDHGRCERCGGVRAEGDAR